MGEEAYDEIDLRSDDPSDKRTLVIRGGYGRENVFIGICSSRDDDPDEIIEISVADLKLALRSMVGGQKERRK